MYNRYEYWKRDAANKAIADRCQPNPTLASGELLHEKLADSFFGMWVRRPYDKLTNRPSRPGMVLLSLVQNV